MKYYVFNSKSRFFVVNTKTEAVEQKKKGLKVFRKEPGIPNPWWVRNVTKTGKLGKLRFLFG